MDAAALRAQIETVLDPAYGPPFAFHEREGKFQLTGIPQIDAITGGLPRGALTEIVGSASSGRTSVLISLLAKMTANHEVCALVDAQDSFDPRSARAAGVELKRLLWVRCPNAVRHGRSQTPEWQAVPLCGSKWQARKSSRDEQRLEVRNMEHALKVTDLLLHSGGFGLVALDAGDIPLRMLRRVPLAYWFRFQRAVEHTPTILLLLEPESAAQSSASLVMRLNHRAARWSRLRNSKLEIRNSAELRAPQSCLLRGLEIEAEIVRSRFETRNSKIETRPSALASNFDFRISSFAKPS